ncbi:MAG: hypothetical protein AABX72_02495 [Nanoarchaeota archaeon]
MGFIQNWIDRKRRRELEQINREIEELKRKGPDFSHHTQERIKQSPTKMVTSSGTDSSKGPWIIGCIIILLGLVLYGWITITSLQSELDNQEEETLQLRDELDLALLHLNTTAKELDIKESVKANLSGQYKDLQDQFRVLEQSMRALNKSFIDMGDELNDTQQELLEKEGYIDDLVDCIDNNSITDKEDCI